MTTGTALPKTSAARRAEPPAGRHRWPLVVLAVAVVAAGLWAFWDLTIDDAYITFRYSQNLADGHGPVWNVGQDPVQGYTNLLWMLLLTPAAWAGASLPVAAKLLGLASLAGTVAVAYLAAADWSGRRWAGLVAGGTLLAMAPTWVHTLAGLETMLYAGLLLAFVWLATRPTSWPVVTAGVLLGLCRPEGWAVAGAGMLYLLWRDRDWWALTIAGAGAAAVGAQWWFYGSPVPNTALVKGGVVNPDEASVLVLLATALVPAVLWATSPGRDRLLVVAVMAVGVAPYLLSSLQMDYAMRFAYHLMPLAVAAAIAAVAHLDGRFIWVVAAVVVLAGAARVDASLLEYGDDLAAAHVVAGKTLAGVQPSGTLAVGDAGAIPYYSGWDTVDLFGLNDEDIARGTSVADRVVEAGVDVMIVRIDPATGVPRGASPGDLDPVLDGFVKVDEVAFRDGYRMAVLMRRGLEPVLGGEVVLDL